MEFQGWNLQKIWDKPQKSWDKPLWTDETNIYHTDGKADVWRRTGSAHDPKQAPLWNTEESHGFTCMTSSWKGSLIFIDDVTHDVRGKMNSEV